MPFPSLPIVTARKTQGPGPLNRKVAEQLVLVHPMPQRRAGLTVSAGKGLPWPRNAATTNIIDSELMIIRNMRGPSNESRLSCGAR